MKKHFLLSIMVAVSVLGSTSLQAQLAPENFNAGVLPANWVLINDGHTVNTGFANTAIQTALNASAWVPLELTTGNYGMITTSYFKTPATADRWLITPSFTVDTINSVLKWDDNDLNSGEHLQVLVSPTGDTSAASFTLVYDQPAFFDATGAGMLSSHAISLEAYNGQTIRVAFRDHVTDGWALVMDNVATDKTMLGNEVALTNISPVAGTPFAYISSTAPGIISGQVMNNGAFALNTFTVFYQQGSNPVVSQTFTPSLPVQPYSSASFSFSTPITYTTAGNFPVKIWISQNGDANQTNDTASTTLIGVDTLVAKTSLFEEFTGASCDPCANAAPNVDSVSVNNSFRMNTIRYHVPIPARDLLYNVTKTDVNTKLSLYAINSAPSGRINGVDVFPAAGFFSSAVVDAQATLSPVSIQATATFNIFTGTFNVSADIKSYTPFAAGLKANIALTVDTITYTRNISLESIPQTRFPEVVEALIPNGSGTTLSAFTAGQTQTVTASWTKNHAWGDRTGGFIYDSSMGGHITIWVQDNASKTVYQSMSIPLSNVSLGVDKIIANNGSIEVYPNPAAQTANVRFDLKKACNVSVEVINIAGQVVSSVTSEYMNEGTHQVVVPVSNLANGVYNVRVNTPEGNVTQRLSVIK